MCVLYSMLRTFQVKYLINVLNEQAYIKYLAVLLYSISSPITVEW